MSYKVNDAVKIVKNIYEAATEHHPGGFIALKGQKVIIRAVRDETILYLGEIDRPTRPYEVSHEDVLDRTFSVAEDEIKPWEVE